MRGRCENLFSHVRHGGRNIQCMPHMLKWEACSHAKTCVQNYCTPPQSKQEAWKVSFFKKLFARLWFAVFWRIKIILTCLIYNVQNIFFFPPKTSSQIYSFLFCHILQSTFNLYLNKVFPWAKQYGRRLQKWCHPKINPGAATKTLNNETLSALWQHWWWFYWHMERSRSCKPCGQKLCNLVDATIAHPKFYLPTRSTSVWMWVDQLQETCNESGQFMVCLVLIPKIGAGPLVKKLPL